MKDLFYVFERWLNYAYILNLSEAMYTSRNISKLLKFISASDVLDER